SASVVRGKSHLQDQTTARIVQQGFGWMLAVIEESRDRRNTFCKIRLFGALNTVSCRASRSLPEAPIQTRSWSSGRHCHSSKSRLHVRYCHHQRRSFEPRVRDHRSKTPSC